jgi:O-antigen/teichoic acid export membrane protein
LRAARFVAKNTFLMTLGLFAGRILAFFIFRKMTGEVETAGTGVWGVAVDLSSMVLTIANFGLVVLITREVVKDRANTWSILWAALRIRWLLSLGVYALLVAYVFTTGYDAPTRLVILIMALGVILEATGMACDSVLQGHEKVEHQTTSQLVSAGVYFVLGWWWLEAGHGIEGVAWANVLSRLARLMVLVPLMARHCGPWRRPAPGEGVGMLWLARMGVPMFMATTFGIISYKIDTVMLMEIVGKLGAGIYTIGHRPLDLFLIIPNIFAMALFPSLQRYREQSVAGTNVDVERMGERALRYLNLLIMPLTLLCILAAEPVIRLIAKSSDLGPSITVFQIVILGLPLQAQSHVYNRLLLTAGRERVFISLGLTVMITNVLLNLMLIPVLGWHGAAMTTVFSLLVGYLLHRRYTRTAGMNVPTRRGLLGTVAALAVAWFAAVGISRMVFPGWAVDWRALPTDGVLPFAVMCLLTGALYAAALFALKVVDRADMRMLRGALTGEGDGV